MNYLGRTCIAFRISLFWIWNDDNIGHFRLLPAILHTVASPAVSRCRVYAASFVAPFWRWNNVSIFCSAKF